MARIFRLAVALLVISWWVPSYAATAQLYYYAFPAGPYRLSAVAACQDRVDEANTHPETNYGHRTYTVVSADISSCWIAWAANEYGSAGTGNSGQLFSNYMCPSNIGVTVGEGTECGVPNNCAAKQGQAWGASTPNGAWKTDRAGAMNFCPDGCTVSGSSNGVAADGYTYISGPWSYTGSSCGDSANPSSGESVAPTSCGAGKCPGTVNGTQVCVACTSNSQQSTTSTASAASSAASGASSTNTSSESGTTTTTTTCTGNSCTTTTNKTTTASDGSKKDESTTKTEPKTDFCTSNPKAAVCKGDEDSKWGGSCSGSFTCDGDAVQCAQAQASWKSACALEIDKTSSVYAHGSAAVDGSGSSDFKSGGSDDAFGLGGYIGNGANYGPMGGCITDYTFEVAGQVLTVPFSNICPYLVPVGYASNAITMVIAMMIVFGGSKKGD